MEMRSLATPRRKISEDCCLQLPAWHVALVTMIACCGCGRGASHATVTGRVTLDGKPVANAFIVFVGEDGRATRPAVIQPDGSYRVERAPTGRVLVSIDGVPDAGPPISGLPPRPGKQPPKEPDDPELALIRAGMAAAAQAPARFKDPAQSGLVLELRPGLNPGCDLDLK